MRGFSSSKHSDFPRIVIGFGRALSVDEIVLARKIEAARASRGISTGTGEDRKLQDLCGTRNAQEAAAGGAVFIHLELDELIRSDEAWK